MHYLLSSSEAHVPGPSLRGDLSKESLEFADLALLNGLDPIVLNKSADTGRVCGEDRVALLELSVFWGIQNFLIRQRSFTRYSGNCSLATILWFPFRTRPVERPRCHLIICDNHRCAREFSGYLSLSVAGMKG